MIRNDTGIVVVDFKRVEEEELSILKVCGRTQSSSRSCLFQKREVGVVIGVVYFKSRELESESLFLKLGSGSRIRSREKNSPTPQP